MTPSSLALPPPDGPIFFLDSVTLTAGLEASRTSARKRIMLPMHRSDQEGVQRLINFVQLGSYIRPHLHPMPECIENVTVLAGCLGFMTFDSEGQVLTRHRLMAGNAACCMVDIEQGVWHTLVPLAPDTVVLEIKRGPYQASTDKRFAPWSPIEGTESAHQWLEEVVATFP